MTERFSNFDDDVDDSGFGSPSIASPGFETTSSSSKKNNSDKKRVVSAHESSFDDFDSDWDSEAPSSSASPGRTSQVPSNINMASSSNSKANGNGTRSSLGGGGDFRDFELPKPLDRDRIRSLDLDDDVNSQFGASRNGIRGETDKKASTGLQLRDFSLTPANDDSQRSRSNGSYREEDIEKKYSSKYDEQMPPMPQVQYEPFSVEPPSHYQNYLYLLKYIHGLKILCAIHMVREATQA